MTNWAFRIPLACAILVVGIFIFLSAYNVNELWIGWLLTIGFFIGSIMNGRELSRVSMNICILSIMVMSACLIWRSSNIHSLNWSEADKVRILPIDNSWEIELTDKNDLLRFTDFGRSGHYTSMVKSGFGVIVYVTHNGSSSRYYIHGDAVGHLPGGFSQSIFVPSQSGLADYIESIIKKHGHARSPTLTKNEIVAVALEYFDRHESLQDKYNRNSYQVIRLAYNNGYSISFPSTKKSGDIDEVMQIHVMDNGSIYKVYINGTWSYKSPTSILDNKP